MGETTLEMARRHVREGEMRVICQRELAAELRRDGHPHVADAADELLALFVSILPAYRQHLKSLLYKSTRPS